MALTVTVPSGTFHLSGIPIWVKVSGANPPEGCFNYKILLKIFSLDGLLKGSPFVDGIAPDENGDAWFDISGYVDQPMDKKFEYPLSGGVNPYPDQTLDINMAPGESYLDSGNNLIETFQGAGETHYIVKGGIGPRNIGVLNDKGSNFYQEYVEGGKWLTNMPENQTVSPVQPVKLWLLAALTGPATLKIKAIYQDGSFFEYAGAHTLYKDILHELNCLPTHNDGINMPMIKTGSVKMIQYDVWIEGLTPTMSFRVDHDYYENSQYLFVANSAGGVDVIWLTGHVETSFETRTIESVRRMGRSGTSRERTVIVASRTGRKKWNISTGWKPREEIEAMEDLLLSKQSWLLYNGTLYPVNIEEGNTKLVNTENDMQSLEIGMAEGHESQYI